MFDKIKEVDFFSGHFAILPTKAAALISDSETETLTLATQSQLNDSHRDPYLEGAPIPHSVDVAPVQGNGGLQKLVAGRDRYLRRTFR